jgi:hypothetical protein
MPWKNGRRSLSHDPVVKAFVDDLIAHKETLTTAAIFRDYLLENYPKAVSQALFLESVPYLLSKRDEQKLFTLEEWLNFHKEAVVLYAGLSEKTLVITDRIPYGAGWWSFLDPSLEDDRSHVPLKILNFLVGWQLRDLSNFSGSYFKAEPPYPYSLALALKDLNKACWHWAVHSFREFFEIED